MRLSVVIPCFNEADTIGTQLEALANQQWSEPWEVIVSDNGSTDGSMDVVKQYEGRLPSLRIVDASGKRGQAYARNVGAKNALGEFIAFCDADDEVGSGWLASMGEALSKWDFVACRIDVHKLSPAWVAEKWDHSQARGLQTGGFLNFLPHAGGSTIGIKRRIHEEVGGFAESCRLGEDTEYCWRVQLKGTALHFVSDAVMHVRLRDTVKGIFLQSFGWGEYRVLLYKKYLPLGLPRHTWKEGIEAWKDLIIGFLKNIHKIRSRRDLVHWAQRLGTRMGQLKGSIKYRIFAI
ncbi:MAG: glycosyl transferase family 2 [Nitrospira sp. SG-bin1]|nr:MAG: glycosyl transferase family 2 [Nitrospira sp. SG-bin1]